MKSIPLKGIHGEGKYLILDDEDYELVKDKSIVVFHDGSIKVDFRDKRPYLHRWILRIPKKKSVVVFHKNGTLFDCRKENLTTLSRNDSHYAAKKRPNVSSKYKGVSRFRGRWIAHISKNHKQYSLGMFDTEEQAAMAYDEASFLIQGRLRITNFEQIPLILKESIVQKLLDLHLQ